MCGPRRSRTATCGPRRLPAALCWSAAGVGWLPDACPVPAFYGWPVVASTAGTGRCACPPASAPQRLPPGVQLTSSGSSACCSLTQGCRAHSPGGEPALHDHPGQVGISGTGVVPCSASVAHSEDLPQRACRPQLAGCYGRRAWRLDEEQHLGSRSTTPSG